MIKLIWRIFWDETVAARALRGIGMGLGFAFATGQVNLSALGLDEKTTELVGIGLAALSMMVRSSGAVNDIPKAIGRRVK